MVAEPLVGSAIKRIHILFRRSRPSTIARIAQPIASSALLTVIARGVTKAGISICLKVIKRLAVLHVIGKIGWSSKTILILGFARNLVAK